MKRIAAMTCALATGALAQDLRLQPAPRAANGSSFAALTASSGTGGAAAPPEPRQTDTRFLASGPGLGANCRFGGPLTFDIAVDRAVGALKGDGTLLNADQLVANGVVSPFAVLEMPAFDVDYFAIPSESLGFAPRARPRQIQWKFTPGTRRQPSVLDWRQQRMGN